MNSTRLASIGLAASLAAILPAIPAQAASVTRTFVSAIGNDNNNCTITQPCATFARAYSLTLADGIIAALDPGKYGPLTITRPITVNGNGWAAITAPAAGNGFTINAVSGNVILTGLEIDGAGAAYNGVVFNSGSSLTITDCVVQNFFWDGMHPTTGNGILIQPSSGTINFAITKTTVSNNSLGGIIYLPSGTPTANGAIDHVTATGNMDGIDFIPQSATGGSTVAAISNSIVSNNSANGIVAGSGQPLTLSINSVNVSGNGFGISASGTAKVLLGQSVITGNTNGTSNTTSSNTFYSVQNNLIGLNGNDVANAALNRTTFTLQ